MIDQYGTFAFSTVASSRVAITRWVHFNFNNPVDPANTYRPIQSAVSTYGFSSGPSNFSPFVKLQLLGTTGYPSSICMYLASGIATGSDGWRVSFHKGYEDVANLPTAMAVVTRMSVTPAVWTITPVGSCTANSNIASLRTSDGLGLYGYYRLPFMITLTAK